METLRTLKSNLAKVSLVVAFLRVEPPLSVLMRSLRCAAKAVGGPQRHATVANESFAGRQAGSGVAQGNGHAEEPSRRCGFTDLRRFDESEQALDSGRDRHVQK